jgi:hypothetical protein
MKTFILFIGLMCLTLSAMAADVTPFKECATLRNAANQQVTGVIKTDAYKFQGQIRRHEKNFILQDGETVDVCSTGPFYPGYKVELTIRTIMPLFTCKTRLSGEIVLRRKEINNFTALYADCK